MLKLYIFLLFIGIQSLPLFSQLPLSLSDAIQKGLTNNYQIQIASKNTEIAQNNNTWGMSGALPSVSFNLNQPFSYTDETSKTQASGRDKYSLIAVSPAVSTRWILFNGFAIKMRKQNFEKLYELSKGSGAIVIENTIQSIILGYYKALLEREKLKIVEQLMALTRDRYRYVQTKKELGSAVTYDVLQAKNAYLNDSSTWLLQSLNTTNSLRNLNLLLGEPPETEYQLTDEFSVQDVEYIYNDLVENMLQGNKTLKNQYLNQEMKRNNVSLQKSSLYPMLSLNAGADLSAGSLKYKGIDAKQSDSYSYYASFSLSYTLFNGGAIRKSIENAATELAISGLQIEELKLTMRNVLFSTFNLYNIRRQLLHVANENIDAAELNLKISNDKFKTGTINSFNYRDVQLIFLNASFNRLESIYNLLESQTELLRFTGSIISEYRE